MNSALDQLIEFGFERESATLALQIADGDIELAANLASMNSVDQLKEMASISVNQDMFRVQQEQAKMMLVIRKDLGMSIGKIAAQVGHAVLFGYKEACQVDPSVVQAWEY